MTKYWRIVTLPFGRLFLHDTDCRVDERTTPAAVLTAPAPTFEHVTQFPVVVHASPAPAVNTAPAPVFEQVAPNLVDVQSSLATAVYTVPAPATEHVAPVLVSEKLYPNSCPSTLRQNVIECMAPRTCVRVRDSGTNRGVSHSCCTTFRRCSQKHVHEMLDDALQFWRTAHRLPR